MKTILTFEQFLEQHGDGMTAEQTIGPKLFSEVNGKIILSATDDVEVYDDEGMNNWVLGEPQTNETAKKVHDAKYPLCARWSDNFDKATTIIDFLNWLTQGHPSEHAEEGRDYELSQWGDTGTRLMPVCKSVEDLAYEYFNINRSEINKERERMLSKLR